MAEDVGINRLVVVPLEDDVVVLEARFEGGGVVAEIVDRHADAALEAELFL